MPHLVLLDEVLQMKKGSGVHGDVYGELTSDDITEVELRTAYAKRWLQTAAPAQYVFTLQDTLPQGARALSDIQQKALTATYDAFTNLPTWSGEAIHAALHGVKEQTGITPKDFFTPFYRAFLDKESGPKLGWFLSTLDKTFVLERLHEQAQSVS
jgi:lysyl-tRNA synthetase class 1